MNRILRRVASAVHTKNLTLTYLSKYSSRLRQAVRFADEVSPRGGRVLRMRLGDREIGAVHMNPSRINQVSLTENMDPQFRGMGLGKKLYGEAARRYGVRRGDQLVLDSDSIVSQNAQRVWGSVLRRHGGVENPWVQRVNFEQGPVLELR